MRKLLVCLSVSFLITPFLTGCAIDGRAGREGESELSDGGGWKRLFNGKNLDGWRVECKPDDKRKVFWRARDGAIVCNSMGGEEHDYVWLITEEEFSDFELRMKIQTFRDSPGNSGVQVRSRFDGEEQWLDGPQVDIHPPEPWRCGYIYDETRELKRWIHPSLPSWDIERLQVKGGQEWKHADEGDGWNTLRIVCRGTAVKTFVNGNKIADFDGAGLLDDEAHRRHNVGMKGHLALQLHADDELHIKYKDILVDSR